MSDVVRVHENGLQVHPLALHQHPDLDALSHQAEALLPLAHLLCKGPHKAAGHHGLQVEAHVLKQQCHLLAACSACLDCFQNIWSVDQDIWPVTRVAVDAPELCCKLIDPTATAQLMQPACACNRLLCSCLYM